MTSLKEALFNDVLTDDIVSTTDAELVSRVEFLMKNGKVVDMLIYHTAPKPEKTSRETKVALSSDGSALGDALLEILAEAIKEREAVSDAL